MLKSDAITYFGSSTEVAKALNITESAVSQWKRLVPEGKAYKLESVTRRALRVDPRMYSKSAVHARRAEQASVG